MSQEARKPNTPHTNPATAHRETTGDGRSFDRVKVVGGAAPEAGAGRVQAARKAHHGDAFGAKGKPTVGSPGPAWASNTPHTNPVQDCNEAGSFILREPVPKQGGVHNSSEED